MANIEAKFSLITEKDTKEFINNRNYTQIFDLEQKLDNADAFTLMASFDPVSKGQSTLQAPQIVCIHNPSEQVAEIQLLIQGITSNPSDTTNGTDSYISYILRPNEYMVLPSVMSVNNDANESTTNGTTLALSNEAPASVMYRDSTADVKSGELNNTTDPVSFDTASAGDGVYFKVGDLIRVEDEIMEITAISTDTLTVNRGLYGSTTVAHTLTPDIRFPYFNAFVDYDKYSTAQTDINGNYKATNLFGYGRTKTANVLDGFVKGTISVKFYEKGYQEIGLAGITNDTNSGLSASTTYDFGIAVDGGSADDVSFTTDSSVLTFGGANGILNKIQDALDIMYYDSTKNIFEKKVKVALIDGDVRFTSQQHLSTSAIVLSADTGGTGTNLWSAGRFPAVADVEASVNAKLPNDTITKDGASINNTDVFLFDDGFGKLVTGGELQGSGTIDYDTGAITLRGCPSIANFVVSGIGESGLACGGNTTANILTKIYARSTNGRRDSIVRVIAYDQ